MRQGSQRVLTAAAVVFLVAASSASANEWVLACDVYGDQVAPQASGVYGIGTSLSCPGNPNPGSYTANSPPGGMAIWTGANNTILQGTAVHWSVNAPSGMTIAGVYVPHMYSWGIDDNTGWGGGFFWSGGSGGVSTWDGESGWSSNTTSGPAFSWPSGGTPYFGWQVVCGRSPCSNGGYQWLSVELLELNVAETSGPWLLSDGMWQTWGWIRGSWRLHYGGDSPSGVCTLAGSLNRQGLPGSSVSANNSTWHQCSAPIVDSSISTAPYGQGAVPLALTATDAAGQTATLSRTVELDNQTPTVSMSGPTDVSASAGTQYVTATASAGPSGVAGISCSLDNAPSTWYATSSVQVPVSDVGVHHLSCYSENNARDSSGIVAASAPEAWTLSIREPSVSTVSFTRVVDALRCARHRERVRIPAHWVIALHHGHRVKVKLPATTRTITVVHCHPRIVRHRVRVHGRWRWKRVVLLPRTVDESRKRVRYGQGAVVSGWLGTDQGSALGGQQVVIFTAPLESGAQFTQAAVATTTANGTWSARLPAGPSRWVVAGYAGASTIEPSGSTAARLIVPALVKLRIRPRSTHWGSTIRISGRLLGGYIPPSGEALVLKLRFRRHTIEVQHIRTAATGAFRTHYTFLGGSGTARYPFWISTIVESGYPFAIGSSRRIPVTVGP